MEGNAEEKRVGMCVMRVFESRQELVDVVRESMQRIPVEYGNRYLLLVIDDNRERIGELLERIGMDETVSGIRYVETALSILLRGENRQTRITKELYPEVARIHQTSQSGVEHGIRSAVRKAWYRADMDELREVFGSYIDEQARRAPKGMSGRPLPPGNSRFLKEAAGYLSGHGRKSGG